MKSFNTWYTVVLYIWEYYLCSKLFVTYSSGFCHQRYIQYTCFKSGEHRLSISCWYLRHRSRLFRITTVLCNCGGLLEHQGYQQQMSLCCFLNLPTCAFNRKKFRVESLSSWTLFCMAVFTFIPSVSWHLWWVKTGMVTWKQSWFFYRQLTSCVV